MNQIKLICIVLTTALFAFNSLAKELPPEGGPARDFDLPEIKRYTLDNGMRVTLVPFGRIPKVAIQVDIRSGNLNEGGNTWLSDFTGELLKEGTELRSADLIAEQSARMGGQLYFSTGLDHSTIGMSVLSEFSEDAVSLVAETIQRPALPESEMERIRNNLIRNLRQSMSQPQTLASDAFYQLIYGDHPYGVTLPSEGQLNNYTHAQILDFYANNFGAQRSHILVAGKFDQNTVLKTIRKEFSGWAKGPVALVSPPEVQSDFRLKLIDRPNAPQSTIIMGLPVPDVKQPEHRLFGQMQTLLGGYFSSRITANLREDKGYTYSPRSYVATRLGQALWQQSADVTTEHTAAALVEIIKEIKLMQNQAPSNDEVQRTQSYQTGTFVLSHATPAGLMARLSSMELYGLPQSYLDDYLTTINSYEAADYQEMAQKHLLIDHMTIVVVGDLDKIRASLLALPELAGINLL